MTDATNAARQARWRARQRDAGELPHDATNAARQARWRAKQRAERGIVPRPKRKPKGPKPFMGIDGEGSGRDRKGRQHYMLMCAGDGVTDYELYTGKPLTTVDCLDFILALPADVILTGFSFGYDVTMILRDLPGEKRADLFAEKLEENPDLAFRRPMGRYTYWRNYGIEFLPGNYLHVCRLQTVQHTDASGITYIRQRPVKGSRRTVWEGFGFFQKRFARALQDFDVGTAEQRRMIARNKSGRDSFVRMTREIRDYCALECELLAQMMERLRTACLDSGIKPRTWNGAGKLANALHKEHGTITKQQLDDWLPSGLRGFAQAAYYGGRFETPRVGAVPGPVWEYDLRSAYPSAMRGLPCLEHGTWHYADPAGIKAAHTAGKLYVATVHYDHTAAAGNLGMCGLPHRQSSSEGRSRYAGVLAWPVMGQGIYWSVEIRSAERLGCRLRFGSGWIYQTACECRPFDWVEPLYLRRRALGSGTAGYPIKLAINSLYGKLAQRVGNPRFGNFVWAGLITAATRAALNEAIAQNPRAIAMIATDGLYSTEPLDLPLGDNLGDWEAATHDAGLFIVQPGLYWPQGPKPKLRTRGVSPVWFTWHVRRRFERAWQAWLTEAQQPGARWREPPVVPLTFRMFIGLRLAQARGKPDTAGCWIDGRTDPAAVKDIAFNWHGKRGAPRWQPGHVHTFPLPGGPDWISASYDTDPLIADVLETVGDELDDQPDFVSFSAEPD